MLPQIATTEIFGFLGAILLAAVVSAAARGLAGGDGSLEREDPPLYAFRKFYIDLAAAFTGLTVLSAGGPTAWTTAPILANITALDGAMTLVPVAVGLLLIALLLARQRWGFRSGKADFLTTIAVAALIVVATLALTSRPATAHSFDRAANRALKSYCSNHSSPVAEILQFSEPLLAEEDERPAQDPRKAPESTLRQQQRILERLREEVSPVIEPALPHSRPFLTSGVSRRTKKKVRGEFCDAVIMYVALRSSRD